MKKKKIVIISRTILPMQAPRSLRATELAKELAKQGHTVTLYAVLGNFDYSEFEKEYKLKVKDVGRMKFATFNSNGVVKNNLLIKLLSKTFRRFVEFPDIELMFKVVDLLKKELNVDLLITIAIPYPLHWGAALAKFKNVDIFPKYWVADCGDPYMGNRFHQPYWYFKYVEKWFCEKTDYITIPIEGARKGYYPEFSDKIKVIPQGFDFKEVKIDLKKPKNPVPTFIYAGAFYQGTRDPKLFMNYLKQLDIDFKFMVYTKNKSIIEPYTIDLGNKLQLNDYIPRTQLLQLMSKADFLVNFDNGTTLQSPSKLIDYALVQRPILSVNSDSIDKSNINNFLLGNYNSQLKIDNIEQYNIKNVANQFLKLTSDGSD